MKRAQQREQAFVLIFEKLFSNLDAQELIELYDENFEEPVCAYTKRLSQSVSEHTQEIDSVIAAFSSGWKVSRISKVDLAVLRLAVYEIAHVDEVPGEVCVNEAVELTKKYAAPSDASFVNGVLGAYLRSETNVSGN